MKRKAPAASCTKLIFWEFSLLSRKLPIRFIAINGGREIRPFANLQGGEVNQYFLCKIARLTMENLALRQQLSVMKRKNPKPRVSNFHRLFWIILSLVWDEWKNALLIVKPETVIAWHRVGFRIFWRFKSRNKNGRPKVSKEIIDLIKRMAKENGTWGAPRIHGELLKLGFEGSQFPSG